MPKSTSGLFTPKNDVLLGRQICFFAAFLLPISKFLEAPSLLAKYAGGDLLVPAALHFLLQAGVLAALLFVLSKSEKTLGERLQEVFGKWTVALYILYAVYYLFHAVLPLLDLEKYVYAAFFDTAPTTFAFGFFFVLAAFVCSKGLKSIGRVADLCVFLFVLPFVALLLMSLSEADYTGLLPLFGTKFGDTVYAFNATTPHFSDVILLLPLLANYRYKKGDAPKIVAGYSVGAACTFLFLASFYAIYSSIAPREHYAFSKIAQYFPALSVVGRIDLIFVYLLSVVLFFYTCIPLHYTTDLLCRTVHTQRRTLIAGALSLGGFVFTLFCNKYYDRFYTLFSGKLWFVFWIFADALPLLLLFLPRKKSGQKERKNV